MISSRWMPLLVAFLIVLTGQPLLAGIDPPIYLDRSPVMQAQTTHTLVGRLVGFRRSAAAADADAGGMSRYTARVRVDRVERGEGLKANSDIDVDFHSSWDLGQLENTRFLNTGCQPEYAALPLPGDPLRLYIRNTPSGRWAAQHPDGFFGLIPEGKTIEALKQDSRRRRLASTSLQGRMARVAVANRPLILSGGLLIAVTALFIGAGVWRARIDAGMEVGILSSGRSIEDL